MGGKKKAPKAPAPTPAPAVPTIDEARKAQDAGDDMLRRRGRAAYLFTGYKGVNPQTGKPYTAKSLLGGA